MISKIAKFPRNFPVVRMTCSEVRTSSVWRHMYVREHVITSNKVSVWHILNIFL